jgi:hypothetical protein
MKESKTNNKSDKIYIEEPGKMKAKRKKKESIQGNEIIKHGY